MSEPTTEAGKRLLAVPSYHWQLCGRAVGDGPCQCALPEAIAAIEAEAVRDALTDLRDRLRGDEDVMAILDEEAGD